VLLIVADTWLHFLTTTVQFTELQALEPNLTFGRGLSGTCLYVYSPEDAANTGDLGGVSNSTPCSTMGTADLVETYATVNKVSLENQILTVNSSGLTYTLLSDAQISDNIDFSATTIACNTQCAPITLACNVNTREFSSLWNTTVEFPPFNCSPGFSGPSRYYGGVDALSNLTLPPQFEYFQMEFFNDSDLIEPADLSSYPVNPTYFGLAVMWEPGYPGGPTSPVFQAENDTEIIEGGTSVGFGYILGCNNTVFDATYTWINGSFQGFLSLTPTNATMAGNLNALQQQPGYVYETNPQTPLGTVNPEIAAAAYLSGFTSGNAQILADKFALSYSQTAMASNAAGIFSPRTNELEQQRSVILVTRLPLVPFYMLVGVSFLYILISIVVALVALYVSSHPYGTASVKQRLNVWGLVEHGFKLPVDEDTQSRTSSDAEVQPAAAKIPIIAVHKTDDNEWDFCVWPRT
jgi:hypothetical protein